MYCPVLLSLACSRPVTSTVGFAPATCGDSVVTSGSLLRIVTSAPGFQARLASRVRYCLATRKSLARTALASRKFLTTSFGRQPGCGPRTRSPQQGPAPGGGAGAVAGCGPVPEGINEHPPASAATATSPMTRAVQPPGRRGTAARGSGITAPQFGAVAGMVGHGVHAGHAVGSGYLLVGAQRQRGADELPAHRARQRQPEDRAPSPLPPGLQPARVQPRVLQGDGQAQPGPAGGPGPGRVGAPEPVENELVLAGT